MFKRLLIGGILAVVVAGILIFFVLKSTDSFQEAEVSEAVPPNALIFIDNADFEFFTEDFTNSKLLWKDLILSTRFSEFDSLVHLFSHQLNNMHLLKTCLDENGLSISLHLLGKDKITALFYLVLGEDYNSQDFNNEIKTVLGKDVLLNERKYEAVELTDVSLNNSFAINEFSFGIKKGLLIASTSSILVEDAIRSLNSNGGISRQKGFKKVSGTAGKYVHGNVYLNYPFIEQLFYPLVNNEFHKRLFQFNDLAKWGEFDIDFRGNDVIFNGMSCVGDSSKGWLNLFNGQSPVKLDITSVIPSNAIKFMAIGISDMDQFKNQFKKELELRDLLQHFQNREKELEKVLGISPFNELMDMVNNEIVKFTVADNKKEGFNDIAIFEVRSKSEAIEKLKRWVTVYAANKGTNPEDYTSKYVLDDQTSYTIYSLPEQFYPKMIPGLFICSSFAFYDNYVIFSNSHDAISQTIYQNILHKTLTNEHFYEEVNNLISTKNNLTIFINPESYFESQKIKLRKSVWDEIHSMSNIIKKTPGFIIQYANENDMYYSNISLKYTSKVKEKAMTVWESLLDSMAITKPVLVVNHNTSEKEIIVQDATNTVCLLNSTGRILWRIKMDGIVLSDIYQIDYYKNGKLQYLFNTAKGIHLIDRNGNYVERYPIKFRADATNGIVLFDYDNRKEYRLFVACENRKVYAYDLEGNIVPGWTFKKSEGKIEKPIQHFRIKAKDYIVFSDPVRTYILDRRGKERVKIKKQIAVSKNNMYYLDMNISEDNPRIVTTDTSGNVFGIDMNGNKSIILPHHATSEHFFRIKDLDQNGIPDFLFGDERNFEVLDLNGKRLFSFKLKSDISTLPDIYEFSSSDLKIGLTDKKSNLIYLLNSDGTLYESFPLEGNTRFSIGYFAGSDSRFNLIVGSQNSFLYNYSIE